MNTNQFIVRALILFLCCLFAGNVAAQTQQDEEGSRQIVLDRFNKARPAEEVTSGVSGARTGASVAVKAPVYRRTGSIKMAGGTRRKPAPEASDEIGVTVWRLRPSQSADAGARVLVLDGLKQSEWTPERIEADTPLKVGRAFFTSSIANNTRTVVSANRC
jgi:hypothetical protein